MSRFIRSAIGAVAALGCLVIIAAPSAVADSIREVSSEVCQNCHKEIYQQWKGSMHANSTALSDPIHGTFYKQVAGDPLQEGLKTKSAPTRSACSAMFRNAALDKATKIDAKVSYKEGVNCVACHDQGVQRHQCARWQAAFGYGVIRASDSLVGRPASAAVCSS